MIALYSDFMLVEKVIMSGVISCKKESKLFENDNVKNEEEKNHFFNI